MPKVKWGSDIAVDDIDSWEDESGGSYAGQKPSSGIFKFKITKLVKGESKAGNPKLTAYMTLVPRTAADKKYDGCPLTDFMPIMKSTVWRFRPFLDCLGVTGKQLLSQTNANGEGEVISIAGVKPAGKELLVQVKLDENEEYLNIKRYMKPVDEDDVDVDVDADADDDDDDDDDEPF